MKKVAFVTGVTGQDGSFLCELLLEKEYVVHGLIRRSSSFNTRRIEHLLQNPNLVLHYGDMTDSGCLMHLMATIKPDEVYNLAAMSHVKVSFELSEYTTDVDALGTLRLLNAIRASGLTQTTKFYQASTSELYGKVKEVPQTENTPFHPRSPYAVAKLHAFWTVVNHREAYGMFAVNGILFNHESHRRGPTFLPRKVAIAVARIKQGLQETLFLGNLEAKRDWGHAADFVKGMWMMLQQQNPDDYVLATGETHSVRELVEKAFDHVNIHVKWIGQGQHEIGVDAHDETKVLVRIDPRYFRPTEVDLLLGDPTKAKHTLGWETTIDFDTLVHSMVDAELGPSKHSLSTYRSTNPSRRDD